MVVEDAEQLLEPLEPAPEDSSVREDPTKRLLRFIEDPKVVPSDEARIYKLIDFLQSGDPDTLFPDQSAPNREEYRDLLAALLEDCHLTDADRIRMFSTRLKEWIAEERSIAQTRQKTAPLGEAKELQTEEEPPVDRRSPVRRAANALQHALRLVKPPPGVVLGLAVALIVSCTLIGFIVWQVPPGSASATITVEYNVGEIIGAVLAGTGAAAAGIGYAVRGVRGE